MVTQNTMRTCEGKLGFFAVHLNKCPAQVALPVSLYTCAPITELPSHISNMDKNICLDKCI